MAATENNKKLKIVEWEVWHNYLTYFSINLPNLETVARRILKSKLTSTIYFSQGYLMYKIGKTTQVSDFTLNYTNRTKPATFTIPSELNDYGRESTYQSAFLRYEELRAFSDSYLDEINYIRFHLNVIYLVVKDKKIALYPMVKLYENGVVLFSYRIIGNKGEHSVVDIVDNYLNLSVSEINDIELDPTISKFEVFHYLMTLKNSLTRFSGLMIYLRFSSNIYKLAHEPGDEEFKFQVAQSILGSNDELLSFDNVKIATMLSLEKALNRFNPISYLIRGFVKHKYTLGNWWMNHPAIYILQTKGKTLNTKTFFNNYRKEFGKLIARSASDNNLNNEIYANKNLRHFDDYLMIPGTGATVFAYSGKLKNEQINKSSSDLIYHKQVLLESNLYRFASYKKLQETSSQSDRKLATMLEDKRKLNSIEVLMDKCTSFGELEEVKVEYDHLFDLVNVKISIKENLLDSIEASKYRRGNLLQLLGIGISIMFGFFGSISIAQSLLKPFLIGLTQWYIPIQETNLYTDFARLSLYQQDSILVLCSLVLMISICFFTFIFIKFLNNDA